MHVFYHVKLRSFYTIFVNCFYHNQMLYLVKGFFLIYCYDHIILIFLNVFMWDITLTDLCMWNHLCAPEMKSTLLWCVIF